MYVPEEVMGVISRVDCMPTYSTDDNGSITDPTWAWVAIRPHIVNICRTYLRGQDISELEDEYVSVCVAEEFAYDELPYVNIASDYALNLFTQLESLTRNMIRAQPILSNYPIILSEIDYCDNSDYFIVTFKV